MVKHRLMAKRSAGTGKPGFNLKAFCKAGTRRREPAAIVLRNISASGIKL
jgi:hypothetical protein